MDMTIDMISQLAVNSRPQRSILTVDFFSRSYRFSAEVDISRHNIIDQLNNHLTDYLEVKNLYVSRLNRPGDIVDTSPVAALPKNNIAFAIIPNENNGLTREHRYSFSKPQVAKVKLAVADFEIKGELELTCKPELNAILTTGTSTFISIFQGVAIHATAADISMRGEAILVNKTMVDYFGLYPTQLTRPANQPARQQIAIPG